jgi:prepilin-type N-terminal cleavage/methylation domain-containing protein
MSRRKESGLSLIELILAITIVGILAGISVPSFAAFKRRAGKAACISHMRAIHVGFDGYMQDNNMWPQMPAAAIDFDESEFFGWWMGTLEPYGAGEGHWLCPLDTIRIDNSKGEKEYAGSYIPTMFDPQSFTPLRWNQPWLLERGDFHGRGAHVMMPDGSVFVSTNPYGEK